jgi:tRNA (adenine22-N1)-methyltransferase
MKDIELSIRMKAVADMIIPGSRVADIGCDHAFIPIYLIEKHIATEVIASDVRKGPVESATRNVALKGLSRQIDIRMGDGFQKISPGEADAAIIAGMGGMLMIKILENAKAVVASMNQLVLQPQSDIEKVRRYIHSCGMAITREMMLEDAGKVYTVMDVSVHGQADCAMEDEHFRYGRYLLEERNPVLQKQLLKEKEKNLHILQAIRNENTDSAKERVQELEKELVYIGSALKYFDGSKE